MHIQKVLMIGLLLAPLMLHAQFKLDVEGAARIDGQLDLIAPGNSIFIGTNTGQNYTTGTNNIFLGYLSGQSNTSGSNNVFIGRLAGVSNTMGGFNTFVGSNAGRFNDVGTDNTFIGGNAGWSNSGGNQNTFLGRDAGFGNTTGNQNTFIGQAAGIANTIGIINTFIGRAAGSANVDGNFNVFVGSSSGQNNTSGSSNLFAGTFAGQNNTAGNFNVFLGHNAGIDNTSGTDNVFVGFAAGQLNQTGRFNTFVGELAGSSNTTGTGNTFVGLSAGALNIDGIQRTGIGQSANSEGADYDNSTGLGYDADPTGANIIHVGNTSVVSIKGQVGFGTYSDGRFKENVRRDEIPGLAFIQALEPVTYNVSIDAFAAWKEAAYGTKDTTNWRGKYDVEQIRFSGFIAQEVEAAAQKAGYDFSGVDKPADDKSFYALRYATFVVPLVQGMQEQQEIIEEQDNAIGDLETEIRKVKSENEQLRNRLSRLENLVDKLVSRDETDEQSIRLSSIRLDQNEPNPFTGTTRIGYFLPSDLTGKAELLVTNAEGREIERVSLENQGEGSIEIEARQLISGNYQYSLLVNGQVVATRRMVRLR